METFNGYLVEKSLNSRLSYLASLIAEHDISLHIVQETVVLSEILGYLKDQFKKGYHRGSDPSGHFQQYQKQAMDALQQLKAHYKGYSDQTGFSKWVDQATAYLQQAQSPTNMPSAQHTGQQQQQQRPGQIIPNDLQLAPLDKKKAQQEPEHYPARFSDHTVR